ncbi:hypothetical protein JMA_41730 (plasmid) [Jeotgalibacillus malaysiensis]|uniref:S1 motif domain-containing protein n=1 Tax=Jeotgalibacillus malaysiensis TaxID=1508404 RepID=A0A0B5ATE4_9BACL|nr:S1 RNA-binding domain-containing protein [Jeotgalibacillus malaysiensis]AJD93490.1 hypothetical protein JMA_41730 [Jeotgalibacillus malaysiensis]
MENNTVAVEKFVAFKEEGRVLTATIRMTKFDEELQTDVLMLDFDGVLAYVPRDEFDIRPVTNSFVPFVGRKIRVLVKDVREDGLVICSRKLVLENKRAELLERMVAGETFKARIKTFTKFGAYVQVEGISFLLQNKYFAEDYTTISEVKNVGDEIEIKLLRVTPNGNLFAEAVEKHKSDTVVNLDMFERDQVVIGTIRNIKPFGVFVCIAPNLDALCPVPEDAEIDMAMKVQFRITKVDKEEGKVRGKILRVLPEEQEEEIL